MNRTCLATIEVNGRRVCYQVAYHVNAVACRLPYGTRPTFAAVTIEDATIVDIDGQLGDGIESIESEEFQLERLTQEKRDELELEVEEANDFKYVGGF